MELTPAVYSHLTHLLMCVCPHVCVVLEGGYCLQSLAEAAALTVRTLLGHAPPRLEDLKEPSESYVTVFFIKHRRQRVSLPVFRTTIVAIYGRVL